MNANADDERRRRRSPTETRPLTAAPFTIALLNRFAPPDGAPTAVAASDLGRRLQAALPGARVCLIASSAVYRPGGPEPALPTERVESFYSGAWPPARLAAALLEGRALARRAADRARVVISLSDPPLLSLWTGPACRRRGRRWIEWTLDRYPDFFAAAGLLAENGPLLRGLARLDARLRPDAMIGLGEGQLARICAGRGHRPPAALLPAGLLPAGLAPAGLAPLSSAPPRPAPPPGAPLTLVYAGTLGEAHDPALLAALLGRADPARFRILLAATGRRAPELLRALAGHPALIRRERLTPDELAAADIHLVSLSAAAARLAVPSKAVTAVCLGRPFLFLGSPESDCWRDLGAAGWLVRTPGDVGPALEAVCDPAGRAARAAAARALGPRLQRRRDDAVALLAGLISQWRHEDAVTAASRPR